MKAGGTLQKMEGDCFFKAVPFFFSRFAGQQRTSCGPHKTIPFLIYMQ